MKEKIEKSEINQFDKNGKIITKMHPDTYIEPARLDAETSNPIDMSNAPDDADHNPLFGINTVDKEIPKKTITLTINKKKV